MLGPSEPHLRISDVQGSASCHGGVGRRLDSQHLVGRIGMPHDIAAMVAFLSSDDGAFVNGELINVHGGHKAGI